MVPETTRLVTTLSRARRDWEPRNHGVRPLPAVIPSKSLSTSS